MIRSKEAVTSLLVHLEDSNRDGTADSPPALPAVGQPHADAKQPVENRPQLSYQLITWTIYFKPVGFSHVHVLLSRSTIGEAR
jgi:hypothetical protein